VYRYAFLVYMCVCVYIALLSALSACARLPTRTVVMSRSVVTATSGDLPRGCFRYVLDFHLRSSAFVSPLGDTVFHNLMRTSREMQKTIAQFYMSSGSPLVVVRPGVGRAELDLVYVRTMLRLAGLVPTGSWLYAAYYGCGGTMEYPSLEEYMRAAVGKLRLHCGFAAGRISLDNVVARRDLYGVSFQRCGVAPPHVGLTFKCGDDLLDRFFLMSCDRPDPYRCSVCTSLNVDHIAGIVSGKWPDALDIVRVVRTSNAGPLRWVCVDLPSVKVVLRSMPGLGVGDGAEMVRCVRAVMTHVFCGVALRLRELWGSVDVGALRFVTVDVRPFYVYGDHGRVTRTVPWMSVCADAFDVDFLYRFLFAGSGSLLLGLSEWVHVSRRGSDFVELDLAVTIMSPVEGVVLDRGFVRNLVGACVRFMEGRARVVLGSLKITVFRGADLAFDSYEGDSAIRYAALRTPEFRSCDTFQQLRALFVGLGVLGSDGGVLRCRSVVVRDERSESDEGCRLAAAMFERVVFSQMMLGGEGCTVYYPYGYVSSAVRGLRRLGFAPGTRVVVRCPDYRDRLFGVDILREERVGALCAVFAGVSCELELRLPVSEFRMHLRLVAEGDSGARYDFVCDLGRIACAVRGLFTRVVGLRRVVLRCEGIACGGTDFDRTLRLVVDVVKEILVSPEYTSIVVATTARACELTIGVGGGRMYTVAFV
jgi:hypothetical protein